MTPTEPDPGAAAAAAMAYAAANLVTKVRALQLEMLRKVVPDLTETEFDTLRSIRNGRPGNGVTRLMIEAYRAGIEHGRELERGV